MEIVQGDSDRCPYGFGNISSRSIVTGGSAAVLAARDIAAKLRTVAGAMLHAEEGEEVVLGGGMAEIAGDGDRHVPIAVVAGAVFSLGYILALDIEPNLESTRTFRPPNIRHTPDHRGNLQVYTTYPFSMHVSLVEVDDETGVVTPLRHVIAHDCGTVVNPAFVDGQVRGGAVMGIGSALGEEFVYDGQRRAAQRRLQDVPAGARVRRAADRARAPGHAEPEHAHRGEGRRRGRLRRRPGRGDERGQRRAARPRRPPRRDARERPERAGRDPGRAPVIPTRFAYEAPGSAEDGVAILDGAAEPRVLAGGTWVVPELGSGVSRPDVVVDLRRAGLGTITEGEGTVMVGATATYADLIGSALVRERLPLLHEMAGGITGGWAIRGQGTIGGSLVAARPQSDVPAVLVALGAVAHVASADGGRAVPVAGAARRADADRPGAAASC